MNRRTLSAALQTGNMTEQAFDFVKAGSAKPMADTAAAAPVQMAGGEESSQVGNDERLRSGLGDQGNFEAEAGLISLTVRVPRTVPPGLLLASVDRKLKRRRPWTQQEIVGEALTLWLKEHGYIS
jgi:hypothetical protein